MTLAGMRADAAASIDEAFHRFNRLTLAFLDQHLKGAQPVAIAGDHITVAHLAAALPPAQLADVMNAIAEGKSEQALKLAAKGIDVPEQTINLAGYNLLGARRFDEAIRIFQMNVDAHPASANAYDSLADGYVAAGNREKAAELARKAQALLESDTTIPAARKQAIRENIEGKLK
jgi:tetratricopeptide (TPR) repeat protein